MALPHVTIVRNVAEKVSDPRLQTALLTILEDHEKLARAERRIADLEFLLRAVTKETTPLGLRSCTNPDQNAVLFQRRAPQMSDLTEQKINALFHAVELLIDVEAERIPRAYGRSGRTWPQDVRLLHAKLQDFSDELKSLLVPRIGLAACIHEALDAHQPPLPFEEPAPSKIEQIEALAEQTDQELLTMDGFDDCIAGVVMQFGRPTITCYDLTKVIDKLIAGGMNHFEAYEWWEYNQVGAYMGESTPCFLDPLVGSGA